MIGLQIAKRRVGKLAEGVVALLGVGAVQRDGLAKLHTVLVLSCEPRNFIARFPLYRRRLRFVGCAAELQTRETLASIGKLRRHIYEPLRQVYVRGRRVVRELDVTLQRFENVPEVTR